MATAPRQSDHSGQTRARRRVLLAQLAGPLRSFLVTEAGSAGPVLGAALLTLAMGQLAVAARVHVAVEDEVVVSVGGRELPMDLRHWVNDGLMAVFFFVIGLEVSASSR